MRTFRKNEFRARIRFATRMSIAGLATGLVSAPVCAAPFPPQINLSTLDPANGGDGTVGVLFNGATRNNGKGRSISGAVDLDADGLKDIVVGAPGVSYSCRMCVAYVAFGREALPPSVDLLQTPFDSNGADAFIVVALSEDERAGSSVSGIGDLNGDGFDDFAVGAPYAHPRRHDRAGGAYVVFGRNSGYPPKFEIASLLPRNGGDGSEGFVLSGIDNYDRTGYGVSGGCDLNGDGLDDLIIGGKDADPPGNVHVVFGRTEGFPPKFDLARLLPHNGGDGSEGFEINADDDDFSGASTSCLGDVNGDGIDDLVVGAPLAEPSNLVHAGEAFLVFGRSIGFPPVFSLAALLPENGGDGSEGTVLEGGEADARAGAAVASAGDVNGDGLADVAVGAYGADIARGRTFVVFGRTAGFPARLRLARLLPGNGGDGSEGFALNGVRDRDKSGYAVAGAGDVNGDGVSDLLVGAPLQDAGNENFNAGAAYLVFGRRSGFPAVVELSSLLRGHGGDGTQGVVFNGTERNEQVGFALAGAGDVNGDGTDDLLIGDPGADQSPGTGPSGHAYLIYGHPAAPDGDGD